MFTLSILGILNSTAQISKLKEQRHLSTDTPDLQTVPFADTQIHIHSIQYHFKHLYIINKIKSQLIKIMLNR